MELDYPCYQQFAPAPANNKRNRDRFIPCRSAKGKLAHQFSLDGADSNYNRLIASSIMHNQHCDRVLNFHDDTVSTVSTEESLFGMLSKHNERTFEKPRSTINLLPQKILDAPEIRDDYYLNLLDWSSHGPLAIGLNQKVFSYTPSHISEICTLQEGYVCSVAFHSHHPLLAVGTSLGRIHLYDVEKECLLRVMRGHYSRVSSLSFSSVLFSGSKDTSILGHDLKCPNSVSMRFDGHRGEICGLKHDPCGLASGSNDNNAIIWDINAGRERHVLNGHKAAVKALAWCPWQRGMLATGGGTTDKTIKFWNSDNGHLMNSINTESQICSLLWNYNERQLISSHGFSHNQLCLWKVHPGLTQYPQATKVVELHGHTQRVLFMALSPDGSTVCSASADETLRFWRISGGEGSQQVDNDADFLYMDNCSIR